MAEWLGFHAIAATRTPFDGRARVRERGRIGRPGAVREMEFEIEAAAIEAGAKVRRQKEKRGYRAISGAGEGDSRQNNVILTFL